MTEIPKAKMFTITADASRVMPAASRRVTSTLLTFAYGLILGSLTAAEADECFNAIDAYFRIAPAPRNSDLVRLLRERGLCDLADRGRRRAPVPAQKKRDQLKAAGWLRNDKAIKSSLASGSPISHVETWLRPYAMPGSGAIVYSPGVSLIAAFQRLIKDSR